MRDEEKSTVGDILLPALKGAGIAFGTGALLLFIIGGIVYSAGDPGKFVTAASMLLLFICSIVSGFASVKLGGDLLSGILAGVMLAFATYALSLSLGDAPDGGLSFSFPYSLLLRLAIPVAATLGALIALRGGNNSNRTKSIIKGKRFRAGAKPRVPKIAR